VIPGRASKFQRSQPVHTTVTSAEAAPSDFYHRNFSSLSGYQTSE